MGGNEFMTFDPMDPLDNMILTSEECDNIVDEIDHYVHASGVGMDHILSESYEFSDEELDCNDPNIYSADGDDIDMPADIASEDAEEFSAAEIELLSGDYGFGSDDAIDMIDDLEFTGMD